MKAFYQSASIGECVDVQFMDRSTPIKLSPQYVTVEQKNICNQVWISKQIVSTIIFGDFYNLFSGDYSCSGAVYW